MTPRQEQILTSIVEQYAEIASPVGSITLAKLFGVSPATIRADMAELEDLGYLTQTHTSSGRIPTDKGYRFYVNTVQGEEGDNIQKQLGPHTKRALEGRIHSKSLPETTIKNAVDTLVELTQNLGLATIGDNLYLSGLSNLFAQPEFARGEGVREVAKLLDNLEPWMREAAPGEPLSVYIGSENPIGGASGCSL
ncbi:MAG TPA: DeoR family transcriptional regulator, partial [Candidatus Saccharimonadales bacterium]|nr:DeoR family transcriptional regulator [Candidatus Saccharimonadales bacterium]